MLNKSQFCGNNMTPQIINLGDLTLANYTGVLVSNASGKWKVYPKVGDMIFVQTARKHLGFSCSELEALPIIDLIKENNVITCDKQGIEFPVQFRIEPCLDDGLIYYFTEKEQ